MTQRDGSGTFPPGVLRGAKVLRSCYLGLTRPRLTVRHAEVSVIGKRQRMESGDRRSLAKVLKRVFASLSALGAATHWCGLIAALLCIFVYALDTVENRGMDFIAHMSFELATGLVVVWIFCWASADKRQQVSVGNLAFMWVLWFFVGPPLWCSLPVRFGIGVGLAVVLAYVRIHFIRKWRRKDSVT